MVLTDGTAISEDVPDHVLGILHGEPILCLVDNHHPAFNCNRLHEFLIHPVQYY